MTGEMAEQIALMAAPIYAAFLARVIATRADNDIPIETLTLLRQHAITEAHALWLDVIETKIP